MNFIRSKLVFTIIMLLTLVVLSSLLFMRFLGEIDKFAQLQQALIQQQAEQTSRSIDEHVLHLRNHMAAISLDDLWLEDLSQFENLVTIQESLADRLKLYFPQMHAYVIANSHGDQIGGDFDFYISDVCQADINSLASIFKPDVEYFDYEPYIHPKPGAYHFDIMIPVYAKQRELIFFMSFDAEILRKVVDEHVISEHQSFLLREDVKGLIEVSENHVRDKLTRENKLSDEEMARIGASVDVPNSLWQVVVVKNPEVYEAFKDQKMIDSMILFFILTAFWFAVFWLGMTHQNRQVRLVSQLSHLSMHDELTGVANRRKLMDEIKYAIDNGRFMHTYSALVYMDLNDFKEINDRCGHDVGDAILVGFANRLQHLTRSDDLVARLGGDEFVILLNKLGGTVDVAGTVLEDTLARFRDNLEKPYLLEAGEFTCAPSIGWVIIDGEISKPADLLMFADQQMYADKQRTKHEPSSDDTT